ncbi:Os05g0408132 [Oryza sativa Japonica Group]|uniref:Os05g0408132 protein n=1 Tax=Oryza sativa subsp. japonica TaxID=39947 RepID=A0A0P0WM90_ORYSJ|nr:Os05g0408132 [Oryza sativa Japonica Group]
MRREHGGVCGGGKRSGTDNASVVCGAGHRRPACNGHVGRDVPHVPPPAFFWQEKDLCRWCGEWAMVTGATDNIDHAVALGLIG